MLEAFLHGKISMRPFKFKQIENIIPEATLTLLTEEKIKAQALIKQNDIQNAQVRYVSLNNLNEELLKLNMDFY